MKALIRLRGCAVWSGPSLSTYAPKHIFKWHSPHVANYNVWPFQAYLSSTDFGTTEDQVEALTRKHEAFEKVLAVQEEKVC